METQFDIENEERIIGKLHILGFADVQRLPKYHRCDLAVIEQGHIQAFVEYKKRSFSSTRYDMALLSLDKWIYLSTLARCTKIKTYLIIGYDDCDMCLEVVDNMPIEATLKDGEPFVLIPLNLFERIDVTK